MKPRIKFINHAGMYTCYEKKNLVTFPGFGKTPYEAWVDYYSKPIMSNYPYCGLIMSATS